MPLLEHLADVNWSALHHAYGPADDVPDLLRALVDPARASPGIVAAAARSKQPVRSQVEWSLWGNVFHQGSRWQVTAHVVPFLVEILRDGPDDDELRRFVLSYLHHLAMGYPQDDFPERFDPEAAFRVVDGMVEPGGAPVYGNESLSSIWSRDSYLAVESSIDAIVPWLDARDEETALEAIALVASFPRRAPTTVPVLRELARSGRDMRAATAALSLTQLVGADALQYAERILAVADESAVAVAAACAAVLASPERASARAMSVLTAPFDEDADVPSVHAGSMRQLVGMSLARVPDSVREASVHAIARQHEGANPIECVSLTASMLALAFRGTSIPAHARDLTALQRHALEAIRDFGAFKLGDGTFANYSSMLRDHGLPDSAERMGGWLADKE
jgi:hypothetical protein